MKLYRFEKFEDNRIETLKEGKLWLSSPLEFNDLQDSNVSAVQMPALSASEYEKVKECMKVVYGDSFDYENFVFSKEVVDALKDYVENCIPNDFKSSLRRNSSVLTVRDDIAKSLGICCFFNGKISDPLLWAHYADNHKGFCVEYEFDPNTKQRIYPVNYCSEPFIPSARELLFCPEETILKIATTKTIHWQYEKEYRLIELFPFTGEEKGKRIELPDYLKLVRVIAGDRVEYFDKLKELGVPVHSFKKVEFQEKRI